MSWIRWSENQVVAQDVKVIPHIELVVPGVVLHSCDVLVLVGEVNIHKLATALLGVVDVVDEAFADFILVVLVRGPDHVEDAADHEGVGGRTLVVGRVPCGLEAECIGVQLAQDHHAIVLLGGIDHPQAVLINRQVNVCLSTPLVWRGVVVVGVVGGRNSL